MAYFLFITRPPHFASRIRRRITSDAWQALLAGDSTFVPVPDSDSAATFEPAPGRPPATLLFKDGNILCKNPDQPTVDKLLALATGLDAILQGEDGEIHTSSTEAPHLTQFALWERPSRRLRIRFPHSMPARFRDISSYVLQPVYVAAEEPLPGAPVDSAGVSELPTRVRMPIGFPSPNRQPSAALRALLNPLRPVQM